MILVFFTILLSLNVICGEFIIEIEISSKEVILGEPIYVCLESEYIGNERITIAEDVFTLDVFMEKGNGELLREKPGEQIESVKALYNEFKEVGRGWRKRKCIELASKYYIDTGEYKIWGRAISKGPYNEKIGNTIKEKKAWEGEIITKKEEIKVTYPEGVDREAYEYFKGNIPLSGERAKEVLEKFPTSTYAGWVVYNISNINYIEKLDIESRYKYSRRTKEDIKKNYKGEYDEREIERVWKEMEREKGEARKRINFLEEFIKERPNFALREYIEFEIGFWSFYVGDYKKAKEKIDGIMKGSKKSLLIEKLRKIEEIIKREGLLK